MSSALLLVPFAAVFVAIAALTACAVALLMRAVPSPRLPHRISETSLWTALALAPVVIGALGCAALASPNPFLECHCALHELHHPHVCLLHPGFARPLLAPAAYLLGGWALLITPRLARLVRDVAVSARSVRALRRLPTAELDGVTLRITDCATRSAITAGVLAPVIVFDRALWNALTEDARRAVIHHEHAHAERRDGFTLLVLRACAALIPAPTSVGLLERWKEAAETACDLHAAQKLGDAAAVAGALVAVEKARSLPGGSPSTLQAPALGIVAGRDLERRVMTLLCAGPASERRSSLGNDALAVTIASLGAAALTLVWPGSVLHHAIETLIGLFVH